MKCSESEQCEILQFSKSCRFLALWVRTHQTFMRLWFLLLQVLFIDQSLATDMSRARVYPDVNVQRPREYWDYESLVVTWG